MALSLAELRYTLFSRVRADQASPAPANIDNSNVSRWFVEVWPEVVAILWDRPAEFEALIEYEKELTITNGSVSVPGDLYRARAVKFSATKRNCTLHDTPESFALFDSRNFLSTPDDTYPHAFVGDGAVKVKSETQTAVKIYVDYVKEHPAIASGTVWGALADKICIELLAAKYWEFKQNDALSMKALQHARSL